MKRSREWKDFILSKETKGEGNLKREGRKGRRAAGLII